MLKMSKKNAPKKVKSLMKTCTRCENPDAEIEEGSDICESCLTEVIAFYEAHEYVSDYIISHEETNEALSGAVAAACDIDVSEVLLYVFQTLKAKVRDCEKDEALGIKLEKLWYAYVRDESIRKTGNPKVWGSEESRKIN
jgi:hypothetical protein